MGQRVNNRLIQFRVPDPRPETWFNVYNDDYYEAPDEYDPHFLERTLFIILL